MVSELMVSILAWCLGGCPCRQVLACGNRVVGLKVDYDNYDGYL